MDAPIEVGAGQTAPGRFREDGGGIAHRCGQLRDRGEDLAEPDAGALAAAEEGSDVDETAEGDPEPPDRDNDDHDRRVVALVVLRSGVHSDGPPMSMAADLARETPRERRTLASGSASGSAEFVSAGDGVEVVRVAAAGQARVAELVEEAVVAEQEGGVARHALGFVDGEGVAVAEVAVVDVLVGDVDGRCRCRVEW